MGFCNDIYLEEQRISNVLEQNEYILVILIP